jgi:hypothetical protein
VAPLIPKRWTGGSDGVSWTLEIEHDRFSETEPFVVSLHATGTDDTGTETTLVCASPEQAREMAAALLVYAHFAAQQNEVADSARHTAGAPR